MSFIYLKFKIDNRVRKTDHKPKTWLRKALGRSVVKVLTSILPAANPDYEEKFDRVVEWWIEIDEESEMPEREIGIDESGNTIMIMPFLRNHGYWTDNNLEKKDFLETFDATPLEENKFKHHWKKFEGTQTSGE
jgi:virulence-associated protein VagC